MINPQSFVLNWSLLSKFHWASFIRKSSPILLCQEESSIVPKVSYLSKASDIFGITTANGSALNSTTSFEESYSSNSERLWYCPSSWSRPMVASKGEAMKQWIEEMRGSREIKFCIMHFAEKKLAKKQLFTWILIFVTHWALLTGVMRHDDNDMISPALRHGDRTSHQRWAGQIGDIGQQLRDSQTRDANLRSVHHNWHKKEMKTQSEVLILF